MHEVTRKRFPASRKWVLGAMRVAHRSSPMTALTQVDVTDAWDRCKVEDVSPTAFVVACVGRAVVAHPEVHAYRDWLGRLVMHRQVDVTTMVEVEAPDGVFPLAHPLQNADSRTVKDLSHELRAIATTPSSGRNGRLVMRWGRALTWIPGLITLFYFVARRSSVLRQGMGTVSLSSVGMMLGGNGYGFGLPTVASISVTVGGATERPWVVDGQVTVRRILDLAVQVDHRVVDGAPAARFGAMLRKLLEHPDLLEW